jgi:glutamate synthase (NADPH/NADH) small chain
MNNKIIRQKPHNLEANYRNKNFEEVEENFTDEQALLEAQRCIQCKNPRCVKGCPVNVNIPAFINEVKNNNIEEAGRILRDSNSLPSVCGRVCPQEKQCEGSCVVGIKDKPVAIGCLERFVGDKTRPEVPQIKHTEKKVAIIGSGCAGMTAAADLAKTGQKVTIFEALHETGGVLRYGIPEFRLPREVLDREVDYLKKLGVDFKTNVVIGKSLTINDLFEEGFEAIFISSGAGLPMLLNISGESLNGVYSANEFLTRINLMKAHREDFHTPIKIGKKAIVVGGGNTAMDSARTAKRIGFEEVVIVYRRSEAELPARLAEIEHAKEEGIKFMLLHSPTEILGENGFVTGLKLQVMELGEPDASGRRKPVPVKDAIIQIDADAVIVALGTSPNPIIQKSALDENLNLEVNAKGYIITEPETGKTSIEGLWAGGDIAPNGESTAINAMGAGKRAAASINEYLENLPTKV